jgi:thiamine-phosphate pyrophosphorylase
LTLRKPSARSRSRYIINDRADIALMLAADGVHVGQDDLPPARVRALVGEDMILGFSTHNEQQLRDGDREPVDYLALGPIFGTPSKQNPDPVVGTAALARLRAFTNKPLVAIGGITRANAREVLAAGASSLAVISDAVGPDLDARLVEWISLIRE